jgi:hypothetical protein
VRGPSRSLTPKEEQDIAERYGNRSEGVIEIARKYRIRTDRVAQIAEKLGVKRRRLLSEEIKQDIVNRYKSGEKIVKIAERYGVANSAISMIAVRYGVQQRLPGRRHLSKQERIDISELYRAGHLSENIASKFNINIESVRIISKKLGVPARPVGTTKRATSRLDENGYCWVPISRNDPFFPMAYSHGQVSEHRLVMARSLGRLLKQDETVHHINGIRDDNRIENLQLRHTAHGRGIVLQCEDCGSNNVISVPIADGDLQ